LRAFLHGELRQGFVWWPGDDRLIDGSATGGMFGSLGNDGDRRPDFLEWFDRGAHANTILMRNGTPDVVMDSPAGTAHESTVASTRSPPWKSSSRARLEQPAASWFGARYAPEFRYTIRLSWTYNA
jgi:hypothetical protein